MMPQINRYAFLMLVTLAILARAVIPAGFMPDFENGKIAIQICQGAELVTVYVEGKDNQEPSQHSKKTCTFAPIAQNNMGAEDQANLSYEAVHYTQISYGLAQEEIISQHSQKLRQPRAPPTIL